MSILSMSLKMVYLSSSWTAHDFFGHPAIVVNVLVGGEIKELSHFLEFIHG